MNPITILLIVIVALLAGMEGVLDEFQFHQPLVACTLIGLVSGHLIKGLDGTTDPTNAINTAIALAIPLSVAGLFLTMICRTLATGIAHIMDASAENGDFAAIERWQVIAILMQGVRIAIPAACLCFIPSEAVTSALNAMPAWLSGGSSPSSPSASSASRSPSSTLASRTWPSRAAALPAPATRSATS